MSAPFLPSFSTKENSSFSLLLPGLQLAVDSTSLGAFKECPRKYFYSILLGLQPRAESVHLVFGLLMHGSIERYHHARAGGASHDDSLDACLDWALKETWNKVLQRPWASDDPNKNRKTLIRTLIWYLDQYGENDPVQTLVLASGKPAVELSFSFDTGRRSRITGEPIQICGHLDRLGLFNDEPVIPDVKTTKSSLSPSFFQKFTPDNQFSIYTWAGRVIWQKPIKLLIVDGIQVLVNSSVFQRGMVSRSEDQLDEFIRDTHWHLDQMEACAEASYWPQNDKSCDKYGGCPFRGVCSRSPQARAPWLEQEFKKRVWDPLLRRGDI